MARNCLFCFRHFLAPFSISRLGFVQNPSFRCYFSRRSFEIGQRAEITRVFEQNVVNVYAELTGDRNPIHIDDEFAKNTRFGGCIVHGALVNGLISCLHGTKMPGTGCIVVSQQIKFPSPLYVGEKVKAVIEVMSYRHSVMVCSALCTAIDRNEVILTGETKLFIPKNVVDC